MRLGKNQLSTLNSVGTNMAIVVPTKETRRLVDLGLMVAEPNGSFARITPAGLRALADAAEAGKVEIPLSIDSFRSTKGGTHDD